MWGRSHAGGCSEALRRALGFAAFRAKRGKNEGFAPLCGVAAIPMAALKTPVAPVALKGREKKSACRARELSAQGRALGSMAQEKLRPTGATDGAARAIVLARLAES